MTGWHAYLQLEVFGHDAADFIPEVLHLVRCRLYVFGLVVLLKPQKSPVSVSITSTVQYHRFSITSVVQYHRYSQLPV